jgi:hypothetical protein
MASSAARLSSDQRAALEMLLADLQSIFGARLRSLVAYGVNGSTTNDQILRTLGLVERLTFDDLHRCVPFTVIWHQRALAVPLLLTHDEFFRTLDVFPLEYGSIIASHVLIAGDDPFEGAHVTDADRRRGCEHQAKSHLIHLREGFLETHGDARDIVRLIAASTPAFRTLLLNIARLETGDAGEYSHETLAAIAERTMGVPPDLVMDILASPNAMGTVAEPTALLARYIEASERIWRFVDGWRS